MKGLLGIGLSVGILAGIWTFVSVELSLVTWVAFVAWACFFAAGGGTTGLKKGLASNLAGIFWGFMISLGIHLSSSTVALAVMVTVVGFILCIEAGWSLLSFIPGGFAGTAVFFGTSFDLLGVLIAVIVGAVLGLVSEIAGAKIQNSIAPATPAPAPATSS